MAKRKRGQGEGSIGKRADGRWAARVSVGYRHGKRARRWVYGKTRQSVAKQLTTLLRDHELGILAMPANLTVERFMTQWLENSARPRLRAKTLESYRQISRLHIVPQLGRIPLQKLAPQHVQQWINDLSKSGWKRKRTKADAAANRPEKRGVSPRTAQYARAILRSALGQALKWGIVPRNVATLIDPPRIVKHQITPLQPDEAVRLIDAAREHRLGALVTVALSLGLRQGEALGLKWNAVDLDAGTLEVRTALQRIGKVWQLVEPKSARSRRSIALPSVAVSALRAHRVKQLEERLAAGADWKDQGFVFSTGTGKPLEPSNLTRVFRSLLTAADCPLIRFHDLRHSCATFLLAQGVDPRTIMESLGHSQISLTMNTYAHVLPNLKRDAAKRMDDLLEK
jgi:integrase